MLRRDGYARFGYAAVAEEVGVTRSAVQQSLGKKDALVLELMVDSEVALDQVAALREDEAAADPRLVLDGLFAHTLAEVDAGLPLCIMGALVTNYDVLPPLLRERSDAFQRRLHVLLAWGLRVGRERGHYRFDGSADAKAEFVVSALRGARLLARQRGRSAVEHTIASLREALA